MSASTTLIETPLFPAAAAGTKASPVTTYLGRLAPGSRRGQLADAQHNRAPSYQGHCRCPGHKLGEPDVSSNRGRPSDSG